MTKDLFDAIRERRSIRHFENREVPDATVNRLLEAAIMAPSAGNLQPWSFFVVKDPEKRRGLSRAAYDQAFVAAAPVVIVVCAEPARSAERYGERGADLYCIQDTAAAVQNMLLAAVALGLGTCWVGAFDEAQAAEVLGLDAARTRPVAMVPVGYPSRTPRPRPRRPLEEVVRVIG